MGIIFLPFILSAILCFAFAIFQVFKKRKSIKTLSLFRGMGISIFLLIIGLFLLIYDGQMYVFAPYVMLPFITILIPYIVYVMKFVKNPEWADSILVSVFFSGIATFLIFYNLTGLLEYFKIPTFH
jgi:hypothetical protein